HVTFDGRVSAISPILYCIRPSWPPPTNRVRIVLWLRPSIATLKRGYANVKSLQQTPASHQSVVSQSPGHDAQVLQPSPVLETVHARQLTGIVEAGRSIGRITSC